MFCMNRHIKDEEAEALFGLLKLKQKYTIKSIYKVKNLTALQLKTLLHVFALNHYPNIELVENLSILLDLHVKTISQWFFDHHNLYQRKLPRQGMKLSSHDLLCIYNKEKANLNKHKISNKK